jgi:multiple sugar transport system permease protein
VLILIVFATSIIPLLALAWISLSDVSTTYIDSFLPRYLTFDNFSRVVLEEGIFRTVANTLFVSFVAGILAPLLTFQLAVLLRKMRNVLSDTIIVLLNMAGVIGGMHTLVPLFGIFRSAGLIDSFLPVVIIYVSHAIPFSVFTIRTYLESIPPSMEDQARIDGLGPLAFNFKILFPLSRPVLLTSFIVSFLGAWNGFLVPLLFLLSDSKYTMGVKLYTFVGSVASGNPKWNLFGAAAIINLLIMGLVFYTFRDYLGKTPLSEHYE